MTSYRYDLHIHSCLSPCADDDMTPANIAGMAHLNGLEIVALTDHNSCKNCPAFFAACRKYGIVPVAGMELTTAEEVHMVCLFPTLEQAMDFDKEIEKFLPPVSNRPEIFGNQLLMDADDIPAGTFGPLLINATSLSLSDTVRLCGQFGGVCYPAHIDRESNGIIGVLGSLPEQPEFPTLEVNSGVDGDLKDICAGKLVLRSSDAHHLWDISDGSSRIPLDDEPYSSGKVRESLIDTIRRGAAE